MKSARVKTSLHTAAAQQAQKLPVSGKIRPGIKVPTKAAGGIPGVMAAYKAGVTADASYADIALAMAAAAPKDAKFPRMPLIPRNAPFFRVHATDFTSPHAADIIMELYGEVREGDTVPKLYSFPIVFPSDDIDLIFREQFEAWKASTIVHWSEPGPEGELQCMSKEQLKADRNRRRQFGAGRQSVSVGPCEPNNCEMFGAGECKHMASLYFWVPGVSGIGTIELEFTSIYASLGIMEILELVREGLGRIKGMANGRPIFRISKVRKDISVMDWQTGKASKQGQYLIMLEADGLDMTQVLDAPVVTERLPEPEPEYIDEETGEIHDEGAVASGQAVIRGMLPALSWTESDLMMFLEAKYGGAGALNNAGAIDRIITDLIEKLPGEKE